MIHIFYKVASAQTLSWFAMDDGKTYGYPDYSNTQEDYDSGEIYAKTAFVIRNDVYEALGKPSMGTQEEFLDVLNQIKEQFPDLIPLDSIILRRMEQVLLEINYRIFWVHRL